MEKFLHPISQPVASKITLPGSKSITNRALLLAALAHGNSTLSSVLFSDDTETFMDALEALGVELDINKPKREIKVAGVDGHFPVRNTEIWCQDAGTAARFLLPACANSPGEYVFDGSARMRVRPIYPLVEVLRQQGASFSPADPRHMPFVISQDTPLIGGNIFISGKQSSTFLSGLLMIAPYAQTAVRLQTDHLISQPYVAMTCKMMQTFGVNVILGDSEYYVAEEQEYYGCNYKVEPDVSTASYFFAAAALTAGDILVHNLDQNDCLQGDMQFLTVLQQMGCEIYQTNEGVGVRGCAQLQGVEVNMGDFSDTFITLACLAPFAKGPTTIHNIAHTRLQESDRIQAVADNLHYLGVRTETGDDYITIYPGEVHAGVVDSCRDHRIAMGFSLLGLRVNGIVIDGAECVAKTCPEFFSLWDQMCKSSRDVCHF